MTRQSNSQTRFDVDGTTAFLTFNRPDARNAMTWEMYGDLAAACDRVDSDPALRVLVLKGEGGKAFVSGTDISQFTEFRTRDDAIEYERRLTAGVERLERVTKPTIAQVQGVATGGGCVLVAVCDLCVCTPDARFGVPIARTLGNCLSADNYARLMDRLGSGRTRDLLLTGRLMDAREAEIAGFASRIVEADAIDEAVRTLARQLADNAPLTLRVTKTMMRAIQVAQRALVPEQDELIAACYGSADFKEGVAAFLAKRTPRFTGQ
jgi:enoyl-CoA hydratase/carnithine racemase